MNIIKLSYKNMISSPLNTLLSLMLLGLGVGIIALLLQLRQHTQHQMQRNLQGIDMVIGAKGSPLQLILSSVYHIDAPTGNIPWEEAEKIKHHRLVASAIPLSYGDSYRGYRIVGTTHDYPAHYQAEIERGRLWEAPLEVVAGATAAKKLQLKIGDRFLGSHGLTADGHVHEDHHYRVVGILSPSLSVIDQLLLTQTESVWQAHDTGHEEHENEDSHDSKTHEEQDEREITAMLVEFKNPMAMIQLPRMVNEQTSMQAAVPSFEIDRLFGLMGVGIQTLNIIAIAIMVVSGLSVFISLYSALKSRKYEMALMRVQGATPWQLMWLVMQEALLLSIIGFVLGILMSRTGLLLTAQLLETNYHFSSAQLAWLSEEWWLLIASLAIGLLASLIPSIRAFHINISETLAHA